MNTQDELEGKSGRGGRYMDVDEALNFATELVRLGELLASQRLEQLTDAL